MTIGATAAAWLAATATLWCGVLLLLPAASGRPAALRLFTPLSAPVSAPLPAAASAGLGRPTALTAASAALLSLWCVTLTTVSAALSTLRCTASATASAALLALWCVTLTAASAAGRRRSGWRRLAARRGRAVSSPSGLWRVARGGAAVRVWAADLVAACWGVLARRRRVGLPPLLWPSLASLPAVAGVWRIAGRGDDVPVVSDLCDPLVVRDVELVGVQHRTVRGVSTHGAC